MMAIQGLSPLLLPLKRALQARAGSLGHSSKSAEDPLITGFRVSMAEMR